MQRCIACGTILSETKRTIFKGKPICLVCRTFKQKSRLPKRRCSVCSSLIPLPFIKFGVCSIDCLVIKLLHDKIKKSEILNLDDLVFNPTLKCVYCGGLLANVKVKEKMKRIAKYGEVALMVYVMKKVKSGGISLFRKIHRNCRLKLRIKIFSHIKTIKQQYSQSQWSQLPPVIFQYAKLINEITMPFYIDLYRFIADHPNPNLRVYGQNLLNSWEKSGIVPQNFTQMFKANANRVIIKRQEEIAHTLWEQGGIK